MAFYNRALTAEEIETIYLVCTAGKCNPFICQDLDGDGYGSPGYGGCPAGAAPDCDDASADTYPSAPQICDGKNNDCSDPTWPTPPSNESTDADDDGVVDGCDTLPCRQQPRSGRPRWGRIRRCL